MNMDDKYNVRERALETADGVAHSAAADKAKGHAREVIGKIKEKIGGAIGDRDMEARGQLQRAAGKKDRLKGEIKEKIEDAKDKIEDAKERIQAGAEVIREKFEEARRRK